MSSHADVHDILTPGGEYLSRLNLGGHAPYHVIGSPDWGRAISAEPVDWRGLDFPSGSFRLSVLKR